jgi:large subunit ribosomal protein L31
LPRKRFNHCGSPIVRSLRATGTALSKEAISLKNVHPELTLATVRCTTCGETFTTRATRREIVVDVCSKCHPAYTGIQRVAHSGSRIERFERRRAAAQAAG